MRACVCVCSRGGGCVCLCVFVSLIATVHNNNPQTNSESLEGDRPRKKEKFTTN